MKAKHSSVDFTMDKDKEIIEQEGRIDINAILEHIGPLGKWQWIQAIYLLLLGAMAGVGAVVFAMTGYVPKHRCLIPQCEEINATDYEWIFNQGFEIHQRSCQRLDFASGSCQNYLDKINEGNLGFIDCPRNEMVFDRSVVKSSIPEDYDMICENSYQRAIFSSLFSFGRLLGSFFIGFISDYFGRVKAIMMSLLLLCGAGIGEAFIGDKTGLAVLRVIYGMGGNGCILATFVLAAEITLPKYSVLITTIPGMGFHVGELLLAIQAYFIREWTILQIAVHAPALILLTLYFIMPESVRWLNVRGKIKQVQELLVKRASINKKEIPTDLLLPKFESETGSSKLGLKDTLKQILKHKKLCLQSFIIFFQFFASFFGYYGTLYSATTLSGDPHINFMLALLCGIPGTLIYLFLPDKIGRKATLILSEIILALSCLSGSLLQYFELSPELQIASSMIARLVAGAAVKTCLIFAAELFPTSIRNIAVSIGGVFGGIGSILGLLMEVFEVYWKPLPVIIVASAQIIAAVMVTFLPETKGRKLPETLEDVIKTMK